MVKSVEVTLFHADWCGHCVNFKPEWKAFQNKIKKINNIYKGVNININEYEHAHLEKIGGGKINGIDIDGYPTIRIKLTCDKEEKEYNYENYGKQRNSDYMTKFIKNICKEFANYKKK
jgi:hypothetical protein